MTKTQEHGAVEDEEASAMHLTNQDQLPAKVANVSREELRKYGHCKRVGNYLLGKTVGEGSFAKVKEAFHILTGEKVAIKIIDKNRARKDRYVSKNMRREARLLQMIRHPHIVQLLEIVETSQCYYLVFEFADGGDLMDYICKNKKLKEEEVRTFVRQIICAVEYLHRLGIIHRDLKIENLLLDAKKNIKIIDFGLSNTIYSPDPSNENPNNENHCSTQCGSPAYAAPELLVRKDYGPQIDVWSIGVNVYAMLTGRLPYTVEPFNISTLYNKMLKRQMNVVPDHLSEDCKDFIHQLLNPNPKERIDILKSAGHRWITKNKQEPLVFTTCPNYLTEEDLEERILDHVESQLKLNSDEVIRDVIQNRATKNSCVYHLLVRRLERYTRDYEGIMSPSDKSIVADDAELHKSQDPCAQPGNNCNVPSPQNGLLPDERPSPRLHIMENPFKAIKIALIRQKNATNNKAKSKSGTTKNAPPSARVQANTPSPNDTKPKLCHVRRVALVKFSPARRSFRAAAPSSRSSLTSLMVGRRLKNHFDVLQRRRKSPKVRRRYAEPDDSLSSIGSVSMLRNSFHARKPPSRRRKENKPNHEVASRDITGSKSGGAKPGEERHDEGAVIRVTPPERKELEEKSLETVTHFYTEKGVVLNRDSHGTTGNVERRSEATTGQDVVQHHVFHSKGTDVDRKEPQRSNEVHEKKTPEITTEQRETDIHVVDVNTASTAVRKDVEKLEPISPKINSSSGTPAPTRNTCVKTPPERTPSIKRIPEENCATPTRVPSKVLNSSKIPIAAGKNAPSRQPPRASRAPSASTGSSRPLRTVVKKVEIQTLVDKYSKCFSVVVVNRPTRVKEVGCGVKAGVKDTGKGAVESERKDDKGETKEDVPTRIDEKKMGKNECEQKIIQNKKRQSEIPATDNRVNSPALNTKDAEKHDANPKTVRKLPRTVRESSMTGLQPMKAKELKRVAPWVGDERRKISNYRKVVSDSPQIKTAIQREIRNAPTYYRNALRPCPIK